MKALICRNWGEPDSLRLEEVAVPVPAARQVLIHVRATAANYADTLLIRGQYQDLPPLPFSPGMETAGVVAACGVEVTRLRPGTRVVAILAHGGMAEYALAEASDTFAIPDAMPFADAGAFPGAYLSSHVALRWQGRLEPGETLLVLGAAGGVGLAAVDIGKAMGARVFAAASSAEKLAAARARGADELIDYAAGDLQQQVMERTGGHGVDVCFDPVGGERCLDALSALAWGGRMVLVGFVAGIPKILANRLVVKHRAVLGSSLRYFQWHAQEKFQRSAAELFELYLGGRLHPTVSRTLPLERGVEAINLLAARQATGRILVIPGRLADGPSPVV